MASTGELTGYLGHFPVSNATHVLHTAGISDVESALFGNGLSMMSKVFNFKRGLTNK